MESFSIGFFPCVREDGFWQPQVYIFRTCNPTGKETICLPYPYIKSIQNSILVKSLGSCDSTWITHVDGRQEHIWLDQLGHMIPTAVARVVGCLDRHINITRRLEVGSQGRSTGTKKAMFSLEVGKKGSLAKARFGYCIVPHPWYHLSTQRHPTLSHLTANLCYVGRCICPVSENNHMDVF